MANRIKTVAMLAIAATFVSVGFADAQTVRKIHAPHVAKIAHNSPLAELTAPPLTVMKRSFLDPGNVRSGWVRNAGVCRGQHGRSCSGLFVLRTCLLRRIGASSAV